MKPGISACWTSADLRSHRPRYDALNAGYLYLEARCLGCDTHQTVALDVVRRPKTTPIHELERYMRCKDCSQVQGYAYKRSPLVAPAGSGRFQRATRRLRGGRENGEARCSIALTEARAILDRLSADLSVCPKSS